jgi:hypothetical protein
MRTGLSLVEILIASAVLAAVLLPLVGLLISSKTDQQSEEGMSEAVTLAANLMETLLSAQVPFEAIDAGGGGNWVKGGPAGTVKQAGFKPTAGLDANELEGLISDGEEIPPGTSEKHRFKNFRGKTYYICLFAGKFPSHPGKEFTEPGFQQPDLKQTLTFSYVERPAPVGFPYDIPNPRRADLNRLVVLDTAQIAVPGNPEAMPYVQKSYAASRNPAEAIPLPPATEYKYKNRVDNLPAGKKNHELLAGWPDVSGVSGLKLDLNDPDTDQRSVWSKNMVGVITGTSGKPTLGYHPIVLDQRKLGMPGGAFMKLVLGVRFSPYQYSQLRKSNDSLREFWVVGFKANLEAQ